MYKPVYVEQCCLVAGAGGHEEGGLPAPLLGQAGEPPRLPHQQPAPAPRYPQLLR
jgi:hypothetical protein